MVSVPAKVIRFALDVEGAHTIFKRAYVPHVDILTRESEFVRFIKIDTISTHSIILRKASEII